MSRVLPAFLLSAALSCHAALPMPQNSPQHKAQLEQDEAVLQSHTLTMDEMTRLIQVMHDLSEAAKADPSLKDSVKTDNGEDQETLDQMSAALSKSPKAVAIFAAHGFTPHSFAVATMSMVQNALAAFAVQNGAKMDDVVKSTHVNPANVKFMLDHQAEIEALKAKYPSES